MKPWILVLGLLGASSNAGVPRAEERGRPHGISLAGPIDAGARPRYGLDGRGRFFCEEPVHLEPPEESNGCPADGLAIEGRLGTISDSKTTERFRTGPWTVTKWSRCGAARRPVVAPSERLLEGAAPVLAGAGDTSLCQRHLREAPPWGTLCRDGRVRLELPPHATVTYVGSTVARISTDGDGGAVTLALPSRTLGSWTIGGDAVPNVCARDETLPVRWSLDLEVICRDDLALVTVQRWRRAVTPPCLPRGGGVTAKGPGAPSCSLTERTPGIVYDVRQRMLVDLARGDARPIRIEPVTLRRAER